MCYALCVWAVDIEPMRLEYSLQPGKSYSGSFKLKNTSTFAIEVYASTGKYRYVFSSGTTPPEGSQSQPPSCEGWFKFEKEKFILSPGEFADAKFIIAVPGDAAKEHLCAVLFDEKKKSEEIRPKRETANIQINLTPRFSIPVYIAIKGNEKISAQIKDMSVVSEPKNGGAWINIVLENTGNVHIRPLGTLVVLNQNSEVAKNLAIGKSLPIFPGYKETVPVLCPKLFPGKYTAVATVEIAKDQIIQKKTVFTFTPAGDIE